MPAYLTHWRILFETLKWLKDNQSALNSHNSQLGTLASNAINYLQNADPQTFRSDPLAGYPAHASKYSWLGAFGPDYIAASSLFAKHGNWVGESILHNNEYKPMTVEFILHLVDKAATKRDTNLLSYAMGYLTHVAGDVVCHPYVNAFGGDHSLYEINQDSWNAKTFFGRSDIHSGDSWAGYLFDDDSDPVKTIINATVDAFKDLIGSRPGDIPDTIDADFDYMMDGYTTTKNALLDIGYDWEVAAFYFLLLLIVFVTIFGSIAFFWGVCREDKKNPHKLWGLTFLEASSISSTICSWILTLTLGIIFRHGVKSNLTKYILLSIVLPLCLFGISQLLKAFNQWCKDVLNSLWFRLSLQGVSLAMSIISLSIEATKGDDKEKDVISMIGNGSSLGFWVLDYLALLMIKGIRTWPFDKDEKSINLIDIITGIVWPFPLTGILLPIVLHVARKKYPPADPDLAYVGIPTNQLELGNNETAALPVSRYTFPTTIELMISKTRIFAGLLCMGVAHYYELTETERITIRQMLEASAGTKTHEWYNWNLNRADKLQWQKIMGTNAITNFIVNEGEFPSTSVPSVPLPDVFLENALKFVTFQKISGLGLS